MSDFQTAAAVIAPFVSTAATSFAGAVVASAQTRLVDSAVERGRELLGRVLNRGTDDPPLTEQDAAATTAIRQLSPAEREILESAIGAWIASGDDLSARSLLAQIKRIADEHPSGDQVNATTYGDGSPAIGKLDTATFYFNRGPDGGAS